MDAAAAASCGVHSLALSPWRPLHLHAASRSTGAFFRPQGASLRTNPGLKWAVADAGCTRKVITASASSSKTSTKRRGRKPSSKSDKSVDGNELVNDTAVSDNVESSSVIDGGAPAVRPRGKRGRPKKPTKVEEPSISQVEDGQKTSEGEFDFFKELDKQMSQEKPNASVEGLGEVEVLDSIPTAAGAKGAASATGKLNGASIVESIEFGGSTAEAASGSGRPGVGQGSRAGIENAVRGQDWIIDLDNRKQLADTADQGTADQARADLGREDESEEDEGEDEGEEEEQPMWVDEEDPTWPDEGDDGWGFRTSQFFDKVSIKPEKKSADSEDSDDEDDDLAESWESEVDDWMIKEITSMEWEATVFAEPSPLVVYVFARYGRRGLDGWNMLKELEKAVLSIWESRKAPLRAVKVDVGMEVDLASALEIDRDECPQLFFIKNGKALHKIEGLRTSEELVQLMAHFFYNGTRPSCLEKTSSPQTLTSIS